MANAQRDNNNVPTKIGVLNTNGATIVRLTANPTTHSLKISDGTTGSNHGPASALRDDNDITVMMGVSSSDFSTPTVIYLDVNGKLMTQST